jgi:hypothetical protein
MSLIKYEIKSTIKPVQFEEIKENTKYTILNFKIGDI